MLSRISKWPAITDPDSTAPEAEIPAESNRRREERDEKAQNYRRKKMHVAALTNSREVYYIQ